MILEDFNAAAEARKVEALLMMTEKKKAISIHLGGIYIECLLKALLVKKYGLTNVTNNGNSWQDTLGNSYPNPGHNLREAFKQLREISDKAPAAVNTDLSCIYKIKDIRYIDYRYKEDSSVSDTEFEAWKKHYIAFVKYCTTRKALIT